jgi:hypothetical protein
MGTIIGLIIFIPLALLWYLFRPVTLRVYCKQPYGDYIELPMQSTRFELITELIRHQEHKDEGQQS